MSSGGAFSFSFLVFDILQFHPLFSILLVGPLFPPIFTPFFFI